MDLFRGPSFLALPLWGLGLSVHGLVLLVVIMCSTGESLLLILISLGVFFFFFFSWLWLYVPVNNFSVMFGWSHCFPGTKKYCRKLMVTYSRTLHGEMCQQIGPESCTLPSYHGPSQILFLLFCKLMTQ